MRKITTSTLIVWFMVLLLIHPIVMFSQKANQYWTTPIADVEFSDSIIVFTFSAEALDQNYNLEPLIYDTRLIVFKRKPGMGSASYSSLKTLKASLTEFISNWDIIHANNSDKHEFLEVCTVLTILNCTQKEILPENTIQVLGCLQKDLRPEIATNAEMVFALYKSYK
jgi:hypothetical protein